MGRRCNPYRERALFLMRRGLATPSEIARALSIPPSTVEGWRHRSKIWTEELRTNRVRKLMMRGMVPAVKLSLDDGIPF
jgi:hypothetical protein